MICSRIRPVHIAAYRENEAMCILRDDFGCEDVEWINVEDIEEIEISTDNQSSSLTPIINDYKKIINIINGYVIIRRGHT